MTDSERSSKELQDKAINAGRQSPWVKARQQGDYVATVKPSADLADPIRADLVVVARLRRKGF